VTVRRTGGVDPFRSEVSRRPRRSNVREVIGYDVESFYASPLADRAFLEGVGSSLPT
jgi:hypothetical protein